MIKSLKFFCVSVLCVLLEVYNYTITCDEVPITITREENDPPCR
jgi:hypothetical protein